ncbi:unknown [Clostridium sp. CAG:149]|nr:unknown [Clostridium sp. CAG:149]
MVEPIGQDNTPVILMVNLLKNILEQLCKSIRKALAVSRKQAEKYREILRFYVNIVWLQKNLLFFQKIFLCTAQHSSCREQDGPNFVIGYKSSFQKP